MENKPNITLNELQHFTYCKRQWGLMYVEGQWIDNARTVSGNIVHELVDDPFFNQKRNNVRTVRSLPIYNDELNIHGIADCVEFTLDKNGVYIPQLEELYSIHIIEYKNGKPLITGVINEADKMQLVAQMMCVNDMFDIVSTGSIFYNTIGRRVKLINQDEAFERVKELLIELQYLTNNKIIPDKPPKQNCNNCSMESVCMPKTLKSISQINRINQLWEAENA